MNTGPLPNLPVVTDETAEQIEVAVSKQASEESCSSIIRDLYSELRLQLKRPPLDPGGSCDPITASTYLRSVLGHVEKAVAELAGGYSAARWLWYLRRLPRHVFEGRLATTFGYDAALAETASGLFGVGADNLRVENGFFRYSIDGPAVKRVLRFCHAVRLMSDIHTALRFAGKGVTFRLEGNDPLPLPCPTPDQQQAIDLYDNRVAAKQHAFIRGGTPLVEQAGRDGGWLLTVTRMQPRWVPSIIGPLVGEHQSVQLLARFLPEAFSFERLRDLNSDPRVLGRTWEGPRAAALFVLLMLAPAVLAVLEHAVPTLMHYGYFALEEDLFRRVLAEYLPTCADHVRGFLPSTPAYRTGEQLLTHLEDITGCLWPLRPGPVLRRSGTQLWVDLYSATNCLDSLLEFPRTPGDAVANARADHFEDVVQAAIDASPWAPPPHVRELRRRELRIRGEKITDVDAIGLHNSTLLLISCKSLIYSAAYDVGDYQTVRNAASTVADAVDHWLQIAARLIETPVGDNYNISTFAELLPIVCTPYPVYVPLGFATSEVRPGVRAAISLDELTDWSQNPKLKKS